MIHMKISAIEPRPKEKSAVFTDGVYYATVYTEILMLYKLKVGQVVDEDSLLDMIESSNKRAAKEKAFNLLSYRDHSYKELVDKLSRSFDKQLAFDAADKMVELGLINDWEFARKLAHDMLFNRKFSARRVQSELILRGIDREAIERILFESAPDPKEQIIALLDKKYANKLNNEKDIKRTVAALSRLGFSYSDIKAAIYEFTNEYIED